MTVILDGNVTGCPQCIEEVLLSVGGNEDQILVDVIYNETSSGTVVVIWLININIDCNNTTQQIEYFFNTTTDDAKPVSVSCAVSVLGKKAVGPGRG